MNVTRDAQLEGPPLIIASLSDRGDEPLTGAWRIATDQENVKFRSNELKLAAVGRYPCVWNSLDGVDADAKKSGHHRHMKEDRQVPLPIHGLEYQIECILLSECDATNTV